MGLYCFDCETACLPDAPPVSPGRVKIAAAAVEVAGSEAGTEPTEEPGQDEFLENQEIRALHNVDSAFLSTWRRGFSAYKDGRWEEASARCSTPLPHPALFLS